MFHIEFYQSLILSKKEMRRIDDGNRPEKPLGVKHKKGEPALHPGFMETRRTKNCRPS